MPLAPPFVDAGFESYAVANGTHRPQTVVDDPPWNFRYPNAFVVDPTFAPKYQGIFDVQAASVAPFQGEQYVSTYAGAAGIGQILPFDYPGTYRVSAYAASPTGSLEITGAGTHVLVGGSFRFRVDNEIFGSTHFTTAGAGWQQYSSLIEIRAAGNHWVGVDNIASANYFLLYDSFSLESVDVVPEPGTSFLAALVAMMARRRRGRKPDSEAL
jgi:hypothetical protein